MTDQEPKPPLKSPKLTPRKSGDEKLAEANRVTGCLELIVRLLAGVLALFR